MDSFKDRAEFLQEHQRYAKVFKAKSLEEQAWALQQAGYATAPNYASSLIALINTHDLMSLDAKLIALNTRS